MQDADSEFSAAYSLPEESYGGKPGIVSTIEQPGITSVRSGRVASTTRSRISIIPRRTRSPRTRGACMTVGARLLYDRYENLIDAACVSAGDGNDFICQFVNQSKTVALQGVEFQIEWRPVLSTRIVMAPAWARIRSHDSSIADSAPPFSFSLLLDRKIAGAPAQGITTAGLRSGPAAEAG